MASRIIICSSVRLWALIQPGITEWQRSKIHCRVPHPLERGMHRGWAYFQARLAFTMAAFNVLVQWHGLEPYASGFVPLSLAEFSL